MAVFLIILAINFFWFVSGGAPLETEAPFRFIVGSMFIFLLPGMLWGEILGFRSKHVLETIALSFAITLVLELILLPVAFLFQSTIRLWIALLFALSLSAVVIVLFKFRNNKETTFLDPLWNIFSQPHPLNIMTPALILILVTVSYGTYRWGENITDIDGEKLLHMSYVRYYFSMPMVLQNLVLAKGVIPLNLIHLWEYLVAGWAALVNVDPLVLFYRARFVIPILGFSGMYLLIANIFPSRAKAEAIIWGVLLMCLGWFALLSPSNLDWVKQDPFRGIMSFMGTAHHADSAMEILVPLLCGLALLAFRKPGWRSFSLLAGVLVASFMWHVREFFQMAVYVGIFGITLLFIPDIDRKKLLMRLGFILAVFLVIAIVFFAIMSLALPVHPHSYDEFKLKELALSYAIQNFMDIRSLFHFPVDLRLTQGLDKNAFITGPQISYLFSNSWNFFLWLVLSAVAIPLLVIKGGKEDKHLSMFYILLWFLVLCWGFSQLLLIVLTYSEINFTAPRMVYVFSYIVISASFCLAFQLFDPSGRKRLILSLIALLAAGFVVKFWWSTGLPLARILSILFSIIFVISFILLMYPKMPKVDSTKFAYPLATVAGIFVFLLPVLFKDYAAVIPRILAEGRPPVAWFDNSPFGFSKDLVQTLKTIPPRQIFLTHPSGKAPVSIYAPQQYAVIPELMGITLVGSRETYNEFHQGKNPLFKADTAPLNTKYITKTPDFAENFKNWKGPDAIKLDIAKAAPPMVLHSYKGEFTFKRNAGQDGSVIRVFPSSGSEPDPIYINFGYAQNDMGFRLNFLPGQEVVFAIDVRVSGIAKNNPPQVFIRDAATGGSTEVSNLPVNQTAWKQYVVRKRIMAGATGLSVGITWQPENRNAWLEIRNVSIYVADAIGRYYQAPEGQARADVNHDAVRTWLDQHHVDYLLIEKDFYSRLLPYFNHHPKDYKIIFNNKQDRELIVQYQRKPA